MKENGKVQRIGTEKTSIKMPRGTKRVVESVTGDAYPISNKEELQKFLTKKGTPKKSALRSQKRQKEFQEELRKAKEEIKRFRKLNAMLKKEQAELRKQQREERRKQREKEKKLREQIRKEREEKRELERQLKAKLAKEKKDKKKRKKQQKSYNQNGGSFSDDTYGTFVDILDEVYDEIALLFYDSDQIMEVIENGELTPEQIKELLIEMNKRKFENLTDKEKELLDSGKYKIPTMENEQMVDDLSECLYLATHSNLTPLEWYEMKQNNPMQFEQEKETVLGNYD